MNLTSQSYGRIRQYLLSEEVTPRTRLSINELSERLGIGRSPVRDAINQLAAEGLVKAEARSGITLRQISLKDMEEIAGLREALEPYAAEQACGRIDYEQLRQLHAACVRMRHLARQIRQAEFEDESLNQAMRSVDWAFHQVILEASGNGRLQKIIDDNHLLLCKVQYPSERTVRHLALTLREHWRIYRGLARRRPDEARKWMWRHARRGGQAMVRSWRRVYEEGA